jgi:hypothetical protein
MKVEINNLNQLLLTILANSQGNILEDRALLTSLDNTKAASLEISKALQSSVALKADLDTRRNAFKSVATCGTRMFFALRSLPALNPMYHFSLVSFLDLFHTALASSTRSADMSLRIASINTVCASLLLRPWSIGQRMSRSTLCVCVGAMLHTHADGLLSRRNSTGVCHSLW